MQADSDVQESSIVVNIEGNGNNNNATSEDGDTYTYASPTLPSERDLFLMHKPRPKVKPRSNQSKFDENNQNNSEHENDKLKTTTDPSGGLYNFLLTFKNLEKGTEFTHTSFCRPTGSFYIPTSRTEEFYRLYNESLLRGENLHITEKHRDIGPVVIDLDFRYDAPPEVQGFIVKRRHTPAHVDAIVECVSSAVARFVIPISRDFDVFVLEKPSPVVSKTMVKDGLHLIVPEIVTRRRPIHDAGDDAERSGVSSCSFGPTHYKSCRGLPGRSSDRKE